jgi:hypothetical protein
MLASLERIIGTTGAPLPPTVGGVGQRRRRVHGPAIGAMQKRGASMHAAPGRMRVALPSTARPHAPGPQTSLSRVAAAAGAGASRRTKAPRRGALVARRAPQWGGPLDAGIQSTGQGPLGHAGGGTWGGGRHQCWRRRLSRRGGRAGGGHGLARTAVEAAAIRPQGKWRGGRRSTAAQAQPRRRWPPGQVRPGAAAPHIWGGKWAGPGSRDAYFCCRQACLARASRV